MAKKEKEKKEDIFDSKSSKEQVKPCDCEAKISLLEEQIDDLKNKLSRSLADYQNLQKQTGQRLENMRVNNLKDILSGLAGVIDNLNHAIESSDGDKGLRVIKQDLKTVIEATGCEIVEPQTGDEYNPHTMEVIGVHPGVVQKEEKKDSDSEKDGETNLTSESITTVNVGLVFDSEVLVSAKILKGVAGN